MELNALHTIMAAGGMVLGLAVGYYKAHSEMNQKFTESQAAINKTLEGYVTVEDCEKCIVKDDLAQIKEDLRDGTRTFTSLKIDMAVIKSRLGVQDDIEELKKSLATLEGQRP